MNDFSEGIPLNKPTLSKMSTKEREFWMDFQEEAFLVIKEKEKAGETQPFVPTEYLQERYEEAIVEYNGSKYCQVQQLKRIFTFEVVGSTH